MFRALVRRASITATVVIIASGLSATAFPALADPRPAPTAASDVEADYQVAPCDPDGTTATDAALANQLNSSLNKKMRGYMSAYRVSCARMVIKAVHDRGLDPRAAVIAITTTIVESSIENISEEVDFDSLGLFQQREAWGEVPDRLNPTWATNAFLNKMIRLYPNNSWRTAPVGEVAQAVQVSAFPDRYQVQAGDAQIIVNTILPHISVPRGRVSVYGVQPDGRLTYAAIDAATGRRTHGNVVSTATLGFTPKAMATLNFNTLLITEDGPEGRLYRVDVITNNTSLSFHPPVHLEDGYTHDLLAFDGTYLFGIAEGRLLRYAINADKPTSANISGQALIGSGFTLKTLTTTGTNWILGTTTSGELISYRINGIGDRTRLPLKDTTWEGISHLMSPGGGVYYGRHPNGALYHYRDTNPHDGDGDDITGLGTVDPKGWSQILLSAQPATVN